MDLKNLLLIITAILNLLIGWLIFRRNKTASLNIFFALTMLGTSLWSIGLAFSREYAGTASSLYWSRSTYFSSLLVVFFLLYFSFVFPYRIIRFTNKIHFLAIAPITAIFLVMLLKSDFIIQKIIATTWGYDLVYQSGYLVFSVIFMYYLIWTFTNLIKKLFISESIHKTQLKAMIWGLGLAGIFGIIFDLILPYFGNWKWNWFGPYFTLITVFAVAYLIFFSNYKIVRK